MQGRDGRQRDFSTHPGDSDAVNPGALIYAKRGGRTARGNGARPDMLEKLRSGDWLTPSRLRVYPMIFLTLFALALVGALLMSKDRMGPNKLPLGTDFSQVWVAGNEARAGHPEAPFDLARHAAAQRAEWGKDIGIFGWHYPPYFLAPALALASLPYLPALTVWQLGTLLLYLAAIFAILRDSRLEKKRIAVLALAFPAAIINLGHGQNGFLTAALLGGGFYLLDRRPLLAGAAFALLAYKPQFGLSLPLALIAGQRWRVIASAAAVLSAMTLATLWVFGAETWRTFFAGLAFTREVVVEQGGPGFEKIQSVFAAVRLLGGDIAAAYFFQSATTVVTLLALVWLWRSAADDRVKAAAAICASLLSTPYSLDYDLMTLAPAIALLASHGLSNGFAAYEKSLLSFAYIAPLVARPLGGLGLPIGIVAVALLFVSAVLLAPRQQRHSTAAPTRWRAF